MDDIVLIEKNITSGCENKIATSSTNSDGLGCFEYIPKHGMVYFLEFKEIQGKKIKSVNLPEPVKSGISLKSTLDQDQRSLSVEL